MNTFAVESRVDDGANLWLCVIDYRGASYPIARFKSRECSEIFNETLALAKMAAHEHGRSGI